jgi:hypothetical protein
VSCERREEKLRIKFCWDGGGEARDGRGQAGLKPLFVDLQPFAISGIFKDTTSNFEGVGTVFPNINFDYVAGSGSSDGCKL